MTGTRPPAAQISDGHAPAIAISGRTLKRLGLTVLFFACVYPVSVSGLSVNYGFLILPIILALLQGRLRYPGDMLMIAIAYFVSVLLIAALYQYDLAIETPRRFASFAIFMSMFSYAFITINSDKIAAFKSAIVCISVYFSVTSAYELLSAAAVATLGFEAKDLVGSQRFGFIYVLAIWLMYLDKQQKELWGVVRYPILVVLLAGLLLTFSRSSVLSICATFLLFAIVKHGKWLANVTLVGVVRAIGFVVGAGVILFVLFKVFPLAFQFFDVRLLGFFEDTEGVRNALADSSSSEGTRVFIATRVLEFVIRNPLTGSGYLGVWVMPNFPAGSAHGQYMDVLFRTGFIGLFLYGCILLGMLRYLWRCEEALFWGLVGVLVYGLFHETFKESQGAFVLSFLVGMTAQFWRDARRQRDTTSSTRHESPPPAASERGSPV